MKKPLFIIVLVSVGLSFFFFNDDRERFFDTSVPKEVLVSDDGFLSPLSAVRAGMIGEAFEEAGIEVAAGDRIFPSRDARISSGMTVFIEREKKVSIRVDGTTKDTVTHVRTVSEALDEGGVVIGEDDIVRPTRETRLDRETDIFVTRVEVREETVEKKIAFDTKETKDDELSWRKRVVTRKGENGIRTYRYRVSYHDGKEVARKLLGSEVTREPVTEIVTQGTYVKTGKSHRGAASWYAHTGTMAAANPWLPMGSYVKVTNVANGKSVIVKINDRGPFVPGRIIDLDRVAFAEIASVGAGVIDVKMEEIVN